MTNNSYFVTSFTATIDVKRNIFDLCTDTKDCYLAVIEVRTVFISALIHIYLYITAVNTTISLRSVPQNQDSVNTDTVCRLYEVGRQRLAEEEEEDEEDQVHSPPSL